MSTPKLPIITSINHGYKLGYYKQSNGRIREAIIQIELLKNSQLVDERQHEIYDFLKTDLAKIVKIESLVGEKIEKAYLLKTPDLKYDVNEEEIIRFKHSEFKEVIPDHTYIGFYTTKIGALNNSSENGENFTGTRLFYLKNGKMKEKHYYISGTKTHTFGYYNNEFNSLHYTWSFEQKPNQAFLTVREYIYNLQENPIAQFVIDQGKITTKKIYDKTDYIHSLYINSIYLDTLN